ncbi:MAG TPA: hypothetical protein PKO03_07255 [Anaerolineaceae bacterium]|nr:hypothetical protein [Anaerolineaceae bacterium]HNS37827.1 hypothetical protein [Anaerolineaceae bacterium]HNZ13998.1 hypothetical protein [Anaerolineaceae bacterium]
MEGKNASSQIGVQSGSVTRNHILWLLYSAAFGLALVIQILSSALTWYRTITYDYFCGNPLMGDWALWFVISLILGALVIPGGIWSIRHRKQRMGIIYRVGSLLYLLSVVVMLTAGIFWGTVPDFLNFIGYAFG